jgi:hypothetical protein
MSTRNNSWGKGGLCVGLTTLPPSCADCLYIWEPQLLKTSGPVQACNGIALPLPASIGRDSSVGIATRYRLDGPGIESRWGASFSVSVQTGRVAHPASYTMGTGSFPGVKWPGHGVAHPPPSSAEVKERVGLYLTPPLCLRGLF